MNESRTNGPLYLRASSDLDVFVNAYLPTFVSGDERVVVYDGKRGYVSRENFDWMKTASLEQLGGMRVMRITETSSKEWLPKAANPESFRWSPERIAVYDPPIPLMCDVPEDQQP